MNENIKAHLTAYCQKNNWEPTDENIQEILIYATPVYSLIGDSHRWYDEEFRVVKIEGMLIGFDWYHVTGDDSIKDMDLGFNMDSICECEKKQKTIDYYEAIAIK